MAEIKEQEEYETNPKRAKELAVQYVQEIHGFHALKNTISASELGHGYYGVIFTARKDEEKKVFDIRIKVLKDAASWRDCSVMEKQ